MSISSNSPWGPPVTASAAPVKLHDVMDEELAAKLQREEEKEWEREIAAQFGDRQSVGWCFVEVPSSDNEYGVMSVIQQEVPMEEQNGDPNDPDYAFALELQAQEAEEYDRLRRQEVSSMERIQVMEQDPNPKPVQTSQQPRRQLRHFLSSSRSRHSLQRYQSASSSGDFRIDEEFEFDSDELDSSSGVHHIHHVDGEYRDSDGAMAREEDEDEENMFLEDDLPITKFNELDLTPRRPERKYRSLPVVASSSSNTSHTSPPSHHRNQYNRSYLATETE